MGHEWFTLDDQLRRDQIINGYSSFIWTERYAAYGDFQTITPSTYNNRKLFTPDTWIGMKGSNRIMQIKTVSDDTDEDGSRALTVTGKSIEALLDDRVAMGSIKDTTTSPNWVLTGTPGDIIRSMFDLICVEGQLDPKDVIPWYNYGQITQPGTIPEPSDTITVTLTPDSLYNGIVTIANTYAMGFRLIKNGDLGQLYFEVYMGNDLTSGQHDRNPIIFGANLNNLDQASLLQSTDGLKTVAYVYAENGSAVVYAPQANMSATGADRRVLLINSDNSDVAGPALTTALQQEAYQGLAAAQKLYAFDGVLPANFSYTYGIDYNLGDIVEERTTDGYKNEMIVTEQIFSSDDTGDNAYPTLVLNETITPGSWAAEKVTAVWNNQPTTEHWADL